MNLIFIGLVVGLIGLHVAGLAALCRRWFDDDGISRAAGVLAVCLLLFFVEHLAGLGHVLYLLPFSAAAAVWLVWRQRPTLRILMAREGPFLLFFGYGFLWRGVFPDIYPTSERVTDLYFISNYLDGGILPPADHWFPPYRFDFYYALQHYGASLLARLLSLDGGTAYNLSYCLVMALSLCLAWSIVSRAVSDPVWRVLGLAAFAVGGTGASPFVHLMFDEQRLGHPTDAWTSMRLVGDYDKQVNTPLGRWLVPQPPPGSPPNPGFVPRQMPVENFSYQFYIGDFHPPLGGFLLLTLGLALMSLLAQDPHHRLAQGCLALTVPVVLATNTWVFPLQALLLAAWLSWRTLLRQPPDWIAIVAGGALGFFLLYPFLDGFTQQALSTPIRWVRPLDHTPWTEWVLLHWPLVLIAVAGLWAGRESPLRFMLTLFLIFLLWMTEFIYVDDPPDDFYERTNTTMKWWGWMWALGVLGVGPLNLRSRVVGARWLTAFALFMVCTYAGDLGRAWWLTPRDSAFYLNGQHWLRGDPAVAHLIDRLAQEPEGRVLESLDKDAYGDTGIIALFAHKPSLLGWPHHVSVWHAGSPPDVPRVHREIDDFFAARQPDAIRWLLDREVRYVVWRPSDNTRSGATFDALQASIRDRYEWIPFYEIPGYRVGLWVLRNARE